MESFDPKDYDDSAANFFGITPVAIKSVVQSASVGKTKQYAFYGEAMLNFVLASYLHDGFLDKNTISLEFAAKFKNFFLSDENLSLVLQSFFTADIQKSPFWNDSTMSAIFKALIYLSSKYNTQAHANDRIQSLLAAVITTQSIQNCKDEIAVYGHCKNALQQEYYHLASSVDLVPDFDWNRLHVSENIIEVMWRSRSRKEYFQYYYVCCGKETDKPPRNTILPDDHVCNRYCWDNPLACHIGKLVNSTSRSHGGGGLGSIPQGKEAHWTCCEQDAHAPGCVSWHKFKKLCMSKSKAHWIAEDARQAMVLYDVLQTAPTKLMSSEEVPILDLNKLNI